MAKTILATLAVLVVIISPAKLSAQIPGCLSHDEIKQSLEVSHGERLAAYGLTESGAVLSIYASPDGQTWTMIITDPGGCSFPVAAGASWEVKVVGVES